MLAEDLRRLRGFFARAYVSTGYGASEKCWTEIQHRSFKTLATLTRFIKAFGTERKNVCEGLRKPSHTLANPRTWSTRSGESMPKPMLKPIDIEALLQWTFREELPKGRPVAASAWDNIEHYC